MKDWQRAMWVSAAVISMACASEEPGAKPAAGPTPNAEEWLKYR